MGGSAFLGAGGTRPRTTRGRTIEEGSLESLNGMLLFGMTAAFLFTMIQRIRPLKKANGMENYQVPGSETVNSCARPIGLIRAAAMKRFFLKAF